MIYMIWRYYNKEAITISTMNVQKIIDLHKKYLHLDWRKIRIRV